MFDYHTTDGMPAYMPKPMPMLLLTPLAAIIMQHSAFSFTASLASRREWLRQKNVVRMQVLSIKCCTFVLKLVNNAPLSAGGTNRRKANGEPYICPRDAGVRCCCCRVLRPVGTMWPAHREGTAGQVAEASAAALHEGAVLARCGDGGGYRARRTGDGGGLRLRPLGCLWTSARTRRVRDACLGRGHADGGEPLVLGERGLGRHLSGSAQLRGRLSATP